MSTATDYLEKFSDVNALPSVVATVNRLINDSESTMKDFEDVIKMDQVLVARLLKLVNSPFYGLTQTVDSISRAVAFLGMKNLHNLVVIDAVQTIFVAPRKTRGFSKKKLWHHSAAVSICSKMIAERIFGVNGDDALLCGILHDFGILIEEQINPIAFESLVSACKSSSTITDLENKAFGTNHCELGHLMTIDWNMSTSVQEAIRDHHLISNEMKPDTLTGIIQISEYITGQINYTTLPEITVDISTPLLQHLQDNIDEYKVLIEDLPEEMQKANAIYG
ncbi:HDOD domain-containing protein [Desulforhopalus sp. IMCC35007]|uniref:HDOD domain-containing protein n=1 Tax=Desulforhopalus sp. IMCC35007 TaxID=2569543 RepID=UPI0010AE8418|nr:HDOD domain-containing protein [Desulforhopalus sp. IMCC35007]TKB06736.1 HDOD domain-containing protein [Desulforhopalus sp. IMCC35007]